MKKILFVLATLLIFTLIPFANLNGQEKKQNYGKAPD